MARRQKRGPPNPARSFVLSGSLARHIALVESLLSPPGDIVWHRLGSTLPRDLSGEARHFLAEASRRYQTGPRSLSPAAETALVAHGWTGNVRELANVMERAVLLSDAEPLGPDDLGLDGAGAAPGRVTTGASGA